MDNKMIGFLLLVSLSIALLGLFLRMDANVSLYLWPGTPVGGFSGQVVWVVGASSGIGRQLAEDFSKQAAKVVLSSRRLAMLDSLADSCRLHYSQAQGELSESESPSVLVLPLDITKHDELQTAFDEILKVYGHIDVLVLNSGIYENRPAINTTLQRSRELMDVNFFSFVDLTKIVLPHMISSGRHAKIAVVSSLAGFLTTPLTGSYGATKHALNGYFNALRAEVSVSHNIDIMLICPGPVYSEMYTNLVEERGKAVTAKVMSTERCSELAIKGIYHRFDEMWIALQPALSFAYLGEYFPTLARKFAEKYIAKNRMKAFNAIGHPER